MSWLVLDKIVPLLTQGDPPSYQKIIAQQRDQPPAPVRWRLFWGERPIGTAESVTLPRPERMTDIESRVDISGLPLAQIAPAWMAPILDAMEAGEATLELEAQSVFSVDPLGRLAGFQSSLGVQGALEKITMHGVVDGGRLRVTVRSGAYVRTTESYLPADALVGDALSPRERLPDLRIGQTWTVPVYSPFRPPNNPMEILKATVERDELVVHEGRAVSARLVVYRADTAQGSRSGVRGRVWVRGDGVVLKQELMVLNSRLVFVREAAGDE